ncbi:MAG: hypothetical protein V4488_01830 [Pseudomonadota bacterium]
MRRAITTRNKYLGVILLGAALPLAVFAAADDGFATPRACAGNALAAALPSQPSLNGYRYVGTQCLSGTNTARYRAGSSVVEISLIDAGGQRSGAGGRPKSAAASDGMAETYESMKLIARSNVDMEKANIALFKRTPSGVGPEYYPVISKLGEDEVATHIPAKEEATGDFTTSGVLKKRYIFGVQVISALAGKDGPAARRTIEPFLEAVKLGML